MSEQQHHGRTHILPKPGDTVSYWVKTATGIVSIIVIIVTIALYVAGIGERVSVVEATQITQERTNEGNTIMLSKIYDILMKVQTDVAEMKGQMRPRSN